MEPTEGRYAFAKTDRWIEWAVRTAKLPVVAGPVIDFRPVCIPEWLYIWEHDYETLRELVYEHIKQVVTRYRRTVARWTVTSGLHVAEGMSLSLERVMDLTRMGVLLVRKLHPAAKVQVEITQPWGEYFALSRRSIPPTVYAEMIGQAGIMVDALAVQLLVGQPGPGRSARDLMSLSALLDRYAEFDKPITVTAIGAPSRAPDASYTGDDPGFCRAPWSPQQQSDWLAQAVAIAASKPFVHSVTWQDLYDPPAPVEPPKPGRATTLLAAAIGCALLSETGAPRPAAARFAEIRRALQGRRSFVSPQVVSA
jgi:hypothetical protein